MGLSERFTQSDIVGYLWPLAIIGGPIVLAVVFIYGTSVARRRPRWCADGGR
jgi:hypothetical protein